MSSVRDALAAAEPHVSLKAALTALIRQSRTLKRAGHDVSLTSRADVDRFTSQAFSGQVDPCEVKGLLRIVLTGDSEDARSQAAMAINDLVESTSLTVHTDPVLIHIDRGPSWLTPHHIDLWLGTSEASVTLAPDEAAAWVYHLDGLDIGGTEIKVRVPLPDGHTLPPLKRSQRARHRERGTQCWLPHSDEEGRYSATPEEIASSQARLLCEMSQTIVDPFCGIGGNAVAAALRGAQVLASDSDHGRLALAKLNAEHFGVASQIRFEVCDAKEAIGRAAQQHPEAALFLDPPWGGLNWDRTGMSAIRLFESVGANTIHESPLSLVVKLPRTFDTTTLQGAGPQWDFHLGLGPNKDHIADRVRLITGVRPRRTGST